MRNLAKVNMQLTDPYRYARTASLGFAIHKQGLACTRYLSRVCGGVAEWLKAADCKSARIAYVGSNPTPSTILRFFRAGVAQW